jgi:hypothetical protein
LMVLTPSALSACSFMGREAAGQAGEGVSPWLGGCG